MSLYGPYTLFQVVSGPRFAAALVAPGSGRGRKSPSSRHELPEAQCLLDGTVMHCGARGRRCGTMQAQSRGCATSDSRGLNKDE